MNSPDSFFSNIRNLGFATTAILDVGANRGDWSRIAAKYFPGAAFLLIEPQEEMRPFLEEFCREHPPSQYFLTAAGSQSGTATITIWDDLAGSSLLPPADEVLRNAGKQRDIPVARIDDLLQESAASIPSLVKLDVQGYELEALRGASTLFGVTDLFVLEVSFFDFYPHQPILHDVVAFMAERQYFAYDIVGGIRRPYDQALGQMDLVFARDGSALRSSNRWS